MPEYRHDPLLGRSVIIAPERWGRPGHFTDGPPADGLPDAQVSAICPFCAGHEQETPPELVAYYSEPRTPDERWRVRVVPNKYPALCANGPGRSPQVDHGVSAGFGSHEVIIESARHVTSFSQLSQEEAWFTFLAYRDRIRVWKSQAGLAHAQVFKNAGTGGGASVEHSHSQLIVTNVVPEDLQRELAAAGEYRLVHRSCFFCTLLACTHDDESRWVAATEQFAAFTPFASRFPYEIWVLPRRHVAFFEDTGPDVLRELAQFLLELVGRMEQVLDKPAYNFWIHTAPFELSRHDDYHWRLVLVPRLSRVAGFELATGCFINAVSPEEAALQLRTAR